MLLKKIITGVLVLAMASSAAMAGFTAHAETNHDEVVAKYEETIYQNGDLGAVYGKNYTEFRVWSPGADSVQTRIYETGSDDETGAAVITTKDMSYDKSTGVWYCKISGDLKNKYYTYIITRGDSQVETADIYAKGAGVNGNRSMVVDLASTNPEGWDSDRHIAVANPTDASVWEVSVRDFSVSPTSGVSENNRGKFLAFTETGTTVNGAENSGATCVDYLKQLGVKYVQIMPFYDFGSIDESKNLSDQYNWGYDPKNYNVPEGSYSSNPYKGEVRINECKQMIKALHDAGIGVIMDVVYNHTYTAEDSFFNLTVPDYYYRRNPDGTLSNGSGCGNDTASENIMFRKYMIDSVTYWASEYHIDGFRFDLMGLHDVETMNQIRANLDKLDGGKNILMYGEAWNLSTSAKNGTVLANQNNMSKLDNRIGAFDDTIRDAIKGSCFVMNEKGFVQSGGKKSELKTGIAGQSKTSTGWAQSPNQCVTYASCHDNYTLYDKLVASVKEQGSDYRKRYEDLVAMNKLSAATVFTSQGTPFLLSGEEFARSKDGEGNSFNTSNSQNELVWSNTTYFGDLVAYYKGLMQIRDSFSAFRDSSPNSANSINYLDDLPDGVVAYTLNNIAVDSENPSISAMCVILNGSGENREINISGDNLPEEWVILANNETAGLRNLGTAKGKVTVAKNSAMILAEKKSFEESGIESDEGAVVVNYVNKSDNSVIASNVITGKVGETYDVTENNVISMDYNIVNTDGKASGEFSKDTVRVTAFCEEYQGGYSNVTIRYVDFETGEDITSSTVLSNREGQIYTTLSIPTVDGYLLDLDNLPENGCGKFGGDDIEVVYKYKRITPEDEGICKVNSVYMDTEGKILDRTTSFGELYQEYSCEDKTFDSYELIQKPHNAMGTYMTGEVNVLYVYAKHEASPLPWIITFVSLGALLLAGGAVFAFSTLKSKKRNKEELDIDD